ncbi:MAG: RNHCP domain-containing protein [Candidatus Vogelbacteria bacterium]|nr:RNHCP domain-containing protein [Candidatus Vogelbacteria bacterium]
MSRVFLKTKENFTCGHCGDKVVGDGYTNHCPKCLWSKHVDVWPGDRRAECGGLMRPVGFTAKSDGYLVLHCCESCGHQKPNKTLTGDNVEVLIGLC